MTNKTSAMRSKIKMECEARRGKERNIVSPYCKHVSPCFHAASIHIRMHRKPADREKGTAMTITHIIACLCVTVSASAGYLRGE